ncbi:MAG: glycine zipper domain-containing protein [Candidatus Methylomirabilales bacterium]
MRNFISLIAVLALLSACAQRPLSTREQGAVTGTALGAGTGAIIGSATGNAGTGAAIGAGLGLLTGAIVGGAIENQREERTYPPPAVGSTQSSASTLPGPSQARVATPTTATANPTVGQFVNGTRWRIKVFVDADSKAVEAASATVLNPQEARQHNLDLGSHRIIAQAYVDTQFGTRTVGRYERTIQVDPRGSGWTLRFTEADFR